MISGEMMVSSRAPRGRRRRLFEKGEKVLCYEPDPSKAKVLYDSKILGVHEVKNRRGRRIVHYKVHFQGWSSSWDRKVNADFVLKDTTENRQLQRDLAEKARLHLDSYLYRKDRNSGRGRGRKRGRKPLGGAACLSVAELAARSELSEDDDNLLISTHLDRHQHTRFSTEDTFSSGSAFEKHENLLMDYDYDTDTYSSSIESFQELERVKLRISERLRQYLEYDHEMVCTYGKLHVIPARIPIINILENFVRQTAVKMVCSCTQPEGTRRRPTQQRTDKKEREYDKIMATINLLKEVADGLRIYFDFTVSQYLLYNEEKEYTSYYLSDDFLKNFHYVETKGISAEYLNSAEEHKSGLLNSLSFSAKDQNSATGKTTPILGDGPRKRKLRSHRSEDCDFMLERCFASIVSPNSNTSTNVGASGSGHNNRSAQQQYQTTLRIPQHMKDFLQGVLSWCLLPTDSKAAPSMIFGAPHLARLIVKLPEFLNASTMADEKLKVLLQHLDTFVNYLESRKDWFNEDNYYRVTTESSASCEFSDAAMEFEENYTSSNTSAIFPISSPTAPATVSTTTSTTTTVTKVPT